MLSTTAAYLSVASNINRQTAATASDPAVKAATSYYLAHITTVKTISAFVNNYQLLSYAMKAYGLGDSVNAKALVTKVLTQGVSSSSALANTIGDPRWRVFATAFDFAGKGDKATSQTSATTTAVSNYVEQALEDQQTKSNPGVALALYFKRTASSITSVYGILANPKLLQVVQTAYGISSQSGQSSIDTQAAVLSKVLKIADLKDPSKVEKLVERFTSQYDVQNNGNATNALLADTTQKGLGASLLASVNGLSSAISGDSVLNLFPSGSGGSQGVGSDLLLSLAKLKQGG